MEGFSIIWTIWKVLAP